MNDTVDTPVKSGENASVTTVREFPAWKRGLALLWVLGLCSLGALFGLAITGFLGSFSGY